MTLWLNRLGRHCEHEDKFLRENHSYLTWGMLHRDVGKMKDCSDLMAVRAEVYAIAHETHGKPLR